VLKDKTDSTLAHMALSSVLAIEQDAPCVRSLQAGDDPQQAGLAAAGRSQQGHQFTGRDGEADIVQGGEAAEGLGYVFYLDAHG
jgi:hypothetical protein